MATSTDRNSFTSPEEKCGFHCPDFHETRPKKLVFFFLDISCHQMLSRPQGKCRKYGRKITL